MNTITATDTVYNISTPSRITRIVFGFSLILVTLISHHTPLGLMAVLPLLAIYPVFTAMVGWDPVKYLCREPRVTRHALHLNTVTRGLLALAGAAMVGSVFMVSGAPGALILLPLLAVYPIFTAILGEEPVTALFNMNTGSGAASLPAHKVEFPKPAQRLNEDYSKEHHNDLAA